MKSEFRKGDLLAKMDWNDSKWIVMNARGNKYELVLLDSENWPFDTKFLEKPFAEGKYVKVGRWDFNLRKEVVEDEG